MPVKKKKKFVPFWIKDAIKKPGALHEDLGVSKDKPIPKDKIKKAAKKGGKVGKRAQLAQTLAGFKKGGTKKKGK